ncbi:hypothetical protein L1887_06299 [Cichorium endivia]|nr:hypothetical protein L1887_06299 [Cichorium endivia]
MSRKTRNEYRVGILGVTILFRITKNPKDLKGRRCLAMIDFLFHHGTQSCFGLRRRGELHLCRLFRLQFISEEGGGGN